MSDSDFIEALLTERATLETRAEKLLAAELKRFRAQEPPVRKSRQTRSTKMNGPTIKIEKRHQYWYFTVTFSPDGNTKVTCEGARMTRAEARESAATAKAGMLEGIRQVTRG